MRGKQNGNCNQRGFTLIELAVVIVLLGLMTAAVLPTVAKRHEVKMVIETREILKSVRSALMGFAIINHRLPCADADGDGLEDCGTLIGEPPWQSLGVGRSDTWNRPLIYRVTQEFTYATQPGLPPAPGQLDLADSGDVSVAGQTTTAPAAVWSTGPDGAPGTADDQAVWLSPLEVLERLQQVAALP